MRVSYICRNNHYVRGGEPCPECKPDVDRRSPLFPDGVQIGMIDGEQEMYGPPEVGPYVNPGKSLKRRLKNNAAWREMIKRSEGKYGDIS